MRSLMIAIFMLIPFGTSGNAQTTCDGILGVDNEEWREAVWASYASGFQTAVAWLNDYLTGNGASIIAAMPNNWRVGDLALRMKTACNDHHDLTLSVALMVAAYDLAGVDYEAMKKELDMMLHSLESQEGPP